MSGKVGRRFPITFLSSASLSSGFPGQIMVNMSNKLMAFFLPDRQKTKTAICSGAYHYVCVYLHCQGFSISVYFQGEGTVLIIKVSEGML